MPAHILDRPILTALTTRQAALAEVNGPARRYPSDIAPFADMDELSDAGFTALHELLRSGEMAVLFTPEPIAPPAQFQVVMAATGEQMIGTPIDAAPSGAQIVRLQATDAPAMRALVALTNPGPFGPRTHELGNFFGVKSNGQLAAMTGERMKPGPYTEMTAVCVHPGHRGRGYAQALLSHVSKQIEARGEIPFLHVFSDNASAIALYKRQGMQVRRRLHVTALARAGDMVSRGIPHAS